MRTAPALLIVALLAGSLSGCFQSSPVVLPEPEPSVAPIFASEEEALAAAEEALIAYHRVSDEILNDGGSGSERLAPFASPDHFAAEAEGHRDVAEKGWHSVGQTVVDNVSLQAFDPFAAEGEEVVSVYACLDLSGVDVLDSSGESVVLPTRASRLPMEVGFISSPRAATELVVSRSDFWPGDDFCV